MVIGTFLWSGSVDYTIRVWDLSTGKCAATLSALGGGSGHTDAVTCMEYIPNMGGEPLIASGSADRTVKIWNPNGGALHHTCTHSSVVTALRAFRDTHGGNNRSFFEFYLLFIHTYMVLYCGLLNHCNISVSVSHYRHTSAAYWTAGRHYSDTLLRHHESTILSQNRPYTNDLVDNRPGSVLLCSWK